MKKLTGVLLFISLSLPLFAQSISGTITDSNGNPLAGANVEVVGTGQGAAADASGAYSVSGVAAGSYSVKASFIGYNSKTLSTTVSSGDANLNFALDASALAGAAVSVIGSRFAHAAQDQAVPVDVFTAQEIRRAGFSETAQILQSLAPSFSMPRTTIADGSDAVRPMTLRGLSSGQVLVLVNGKRRHTTALVHVNNSPSRGDTGVDINAIPASSIERIEVLRDGAAAQYGSDAIAGVINIVLKSGDSAGSFSVTTGASNHTVEAVPTGYDLYDWEANGAPYEWNPTTIADKNGIVQSSEESVKNDGDVMQVQYNKGFALGDDGYFNVSAEYRHRGRTNRIGFEGETLYEPESDYWSGNEAEENRLNPGSDWYIDPQRMIWGDGQQDNYGIFFNTELPAGDRTFYAFGGYSQRNSDAGCYTRGPDHPNKTWLSASPTGYVPHITPTIYDFSTSMGIKGVFGTWSYDLSNTSGNNDFHYKMFSTNASFGPEQIRTYDIGGFTFDQNTTNLDLTTEMGGINVAVGGELRSESYRIYPGEYASYANGHYDDTSVAGWDSSYVDSTGETQYVELNSASGSSGCQCFGGFKPSNAVATANADRSSYAAYADAEMEVMDGMRVGFAGRFEDYSDFGSNFSYKASLRYEVMEGIVLRGAYSTGFRAPALAQAYQSKISTNFIDGVAFEVGTFPVDHPVAQALGATTLTPELSTNMSGGLSANVAGIRLTFDYYNVNIEDRVVMTGNFTTGGGTQENGQVVSHNDDEGSLGAHVYDLLVAAGVEGADYGGGGRFFANAVDTKTSGFDVSAAYDMNLGSMGALDFTLAYNNNTTEIVGEIKTPDELAAYGGNIFDANEVRTMTTVTPKDNMVFTTKYSNGGWAGSFRFNKVGEFESRRTEGLIFSAKSIMDLEGSYDFGAVTVGIGSKNFTDQMPDKWTGSNNDGAFVYPNFAPYGMNGRYDYMKLSYNF